MDTIVQEPALSAMPSTWAAAQGFATGDASRVFLDVVSGNAVGSVSADGKTVIAISGAGVTLNGNANQAINNTATELPYNVGPEKVTSRIVELVTSKKLAGIANVDAALKDRTVHPYEGIAVAFKVGADELVRLALDDDDAGVLDRRGAQDLANVGRR